MHIKSVTRATAIAVAASFATAFGAQAAPVKFNVTAVFGAIDTGLSTVGSFEYDPDTGAFSRIELTTPTGSIASGVYVRALPSSSASVLNFVSTDGADLTGASRFFLGLNGSLTSLISGAAPSLNVLFGFEGICQSATCPFPGFGPGLARGFAAGTHVVLDPDTDDDGVLNAADHCPGTVIPEAAPTSGELGNGRHAITQPGSIAFSAGKSANASYDTADTAGCSCEQIVDELFLGAGHLKYGCSNGVMETWVNGLPFNPNNP